METEHINQLQNQLTNLSQRNADIRDYMDYQGKKERLEEVIGLSEDPELWNDPKRAQVDDLQNGYEALSELARSELGYIEEGETYYNLKRE